MAATIIAGREWQAQVLSAAVGAWGRQKSAESDIIGRRLWFFGKFGGRSIFTADNARTCLDLTRQRLDTLSLGLNDA